MGATKYFSILSGLFILMAAPWAQATITVSSLGGYSEVKLPDTSTGSTTNVYTIYGGFAGTCDTADMNNSTTCNSCRGTAGVTASGVALTACNPKSAYSTLNLHLDLVTSTSALSGGTITATINDTNIVPSNTPPAIVAGSVVPVEFTWGEICSKASSGGSCTSESINTTLEVTFKNGATTETIEFTIVTRAIDATDTTIQFHTACDVNTDSPQGGACNVGFLKGDEKAYIDPNIFSVATDYPSTGSGNVKYANVVFFYESGNMNAAPDSIFSTITNASATKDISTDTSQTPPVSDNRIDGLSNDTQYCFVMANKDQAGNISRFTPVSFSTPAGTIAGAQMCVVPEKVAGLLDGKSCFIATAAFGSDMAPEVETFRQFRNQFLLTHQWGKNFVRTYYEYSPKYAAIIAQNDLLRATTRIALWPMLMLVKVSLAWGAWAVFSILGLAAGLVTFGGLHLRRKKETA